MLAFLALTALTGDPFGLGTPWASVFDPIVANPTTVHTVAELRAAVARRGDIRLVAGTYDLSQGLQVNSGTVIEGAGEGKTVLEVGGPGAATGDAGSIALFGTEIGLRNLTVRNRNADAKPNRVLRGHVGTNTNVHTFFDHVEFLIGNGLAINLNGPTDSLVRGCRFVSTCASDGPVLIAGGTGLRFESNVMDFRAGRCVLGFLTDATIRNNQFLNDGAYHDGNSAETGGVELSYAHNVDFDHNRVVQYGPEGTGANDGEMVGTQASNVPEWQGTGRVVSVDGLDVATDLRWGDDPWLSPRHPITQRRGIFVLSGPAAGQWRWTTPRTDGTVRVDRPWRVAPRSGDQVTVGSVSAYRLRITNNTVEHGTRGIQLYNGGLECRVAGNMVRDTGGIAMWSNSLRSGRTPHTVYENWPLWNCQIVGNTIVNTTGWRPAALTLLDVDVSDTGSPFALKNVVVKGNVVRGRDQTRTANGLSESDGVQVVSLNQGGGPIHEGRQVWVALGRNSLQRARQAAP